MRFDLLPVLVATVVLLPLPVRAQTAVSDGPASDTFADSGARDLILRALALRSTAASGLESYEATVTERTHVGMAITRRLPLRDRTVYHREQMARVYWRADGLHRLRWIGRREGAPVTGDGWAENAPFHIDFDIVDDLGLDDIGVDLLFDPFGDRMDVFDAEFVQPVSASGLNLYRFRSSDTMQIRLPSPDRTITLVEVVISPRVESWETVEGSLWFDRDTGMLVRAAYRPSGVWDQEVREPGDLDDVPGFLRPAIGTVKSIVIEYGLYERRWWLPRRIYGEGEFDWGHGLVRMPLQVEWTMSEHTLNQTVGPMFTEEGLIQTGRQIRGDDERRERIQFLAPDGVDLSRAPELPPPLADSPLLAFTSAELEPLIARIRQTAGQAPTGPPPGFGRALLSSIRYDRVRGPSTALGVVVHAGPIGIEARARAAIAMPDVETMLAFSRGAARLDLYRQLDDASDWNIADGLGNSAATLLFGHDGGDYYRVTGASLTFTNRARRVRTSIELFAEAQRSVDRQTNVSLATMGGGSLRENIAAAPIDLAGLRASFAGQFGSDVGLGVLNWRIVAEAATGDADWGRTLGNVRYSGSFSQTAAFAVDISGGLAGVGAPVQREFLLGGAGTIRGVHENAIRGPAFWLARFESGFGLAGLRAIGFLDTGWAGERDGITKSRPATGLGAGASLFDGLLRFDIARGVSRAAAWRVYFRIDALL